MAETLNLCAGEKKDETTDLSCCIHSEMSNTILYVPCTGDSGNYGHKRPEHQYIHPHMRRHLESCLIIGPGKLFLLRSMRRHRYS